MKNKRRDFLKLTSAAGLSIAGNMFKGFATLADNSKSNIMTSTNNLTYEKDVSIIGLYGPWAAALTENKLPSFSFRKNEFQNLAAWRKKARERLVERLAIPAIGGTDNKLLARLLKNV
jgi:hypothetical protein